MDFDKDASTFFFQQSLSINAINKETQSIDRKAHLFWEIPTIDAKINELMDTLSNSGKAAARLQMTGDSKDARNFFIIKKKEQERGITHELSFVDSLFMMYQLRRKIVKAQSEIKAYNSVKTYSHNFGDFVFYKSMNFRSSYLENLAKTKNDELNGEAKVKAVEYFLEVMILQYNTLLFNCETQFMELIMWISSFHCLKGKRLISILSF